MAAHHLPRRRLDHAFTLLDEVGPPGMRRVIILIETQTSDTGWLTTARLWPSAVSRQVGAGAGIDLLKGKSPRD